MGAALIVPVLAILVALAIWLVFAVGKTSQARRAEETLPDEPYARHDEELRRMRAEHAEANPPEI
ncbi:MAG TPA: hypothetical protein VFJ98_09505 [Mycobacteriales bacterium]|jgi:hypothetical protein|nr:hypothetical protein [Mycobacteriales bacterium]